MSRYLRFSLLAGSLGVAVLAIGGCSGNATPSPAGGNAATAAPSASSPSTASAAPSPSGGALNVPGLSGPFEQQKQAALTAYEEMVNSWVSAGRTANYKDPALAQYASGDALEMLTSTLMTEQSKGQISKGSPTVTDITFGQLIPSSDPTEVVINSCFSDAAWLEYKASDGSLYNNVPGGRHRTQVLAKEESGTWKIDQVAMNGVGTC